MTAMKWGRRTLSLRARLLIGLIALTAMVLVVMGVVSTMVLGGPEQNQFNAELRLAATAECRAASRISRFPLGVRSPRAVAVRCAARAAPARTRSRSSSGSSMTNGRSRPARTDGTQSSR